MSRKDSTARFVVTARLLGADTSNKKRGKEVEYAIEVILSDESKYTVYRTLKEVATFNAKLLAKFPVEAGYFKRDERLIPDCPVKQTVFGPQRSIRDDRSFEKLLNSYIKELPGLPAALVKSDLINNFFSLKASDLDVPGETNSKKNGGKKSKGITLTDTSTITGPMALKSYYAVSSYKAKKGSFSFNEGDVIQVIQKDPSGWWMVDASGIMGWAPASYLVPVDDSTLREETQENQELIGNERAGARYISISSYQASRDDELSFVRGAVVKVLKKYIDGWWLVRYNGGEGFVPGAMFKKFDKRQATVYVKKIQRNFANRRSTKIMPTFKPNWMTTRGRNPDGSLVRKKRTSETKNVVVYQCKADFTGNAERHELTTGKGDHVNVIDKTDGGWWFVQDENSRTGWIPATYLQPIVDNESSNQDTVVGTDRKVIRAHTAQKDDELSIKVGEVVEVVRTSQDGWWFVTSLATFDQGLVPLVCLSEEPVQQNGSTNGTQDVPHHRLRSNSKSTSNLESEVDTKPRTPLVSRSTSDRGYEMSASLKRDLGSELSITSSNSDQYYDDDATGEQFDEFDEDDDLDSIDMEECYVVKRDYTRLSMDELDVYEGQMVCIIDDSDRDMWYVNADGKEGWLPSNILRAMMGDEATMTSGESTPAGTTKLGSTGASADASDMSDSDDHNSYSQKSVSSGNSSRAFKRSKVIRKSSSQEPPEAHRPRLDHESSTPRDLRKKSRSETSSDGEVQSSAGSSITIMVGDKTIEELEREAAEAERMANEAKLKAKQLRDQVKDAKRRSASSGR